MQDLIWRLAAAFIVLTSTMIVQAAGQDGDATCLVEPTPNCVLDLTVHEIGEIEDAVARGQILGILIDHLIAEGDIVNALATAELVEDLEFRAYLLHPAFSFGLPRTDDERENRLIDSDVSRIWRQIEDLREQADALIDQAVRLAESGAMDRAVKRVENIELPDDRIRGLIAIAAAQTSSDDTAGARRTFHAAWQAASQLVDPVRQQDALTVIATAQMEADDAAGALQNAQSIDRLPARVGALRALAFAQNTDDIEQGLATLHLAWDAVLDHNGNPHDLFYLSGQLQEISAAFVVAGDRSAAELTGALSSAMADTMHGILEPVENAERQASGGEVTDALVGAYGIEDEYVRTLALIAIVEAMPKT